MALAHECCWTQLNAQSVQSEQESERERVWIPVLLMYLYRER